MLQELGVHRRAITHYQELRCRSLIEVPIALLQMVEKHYNILNGSQEVSGSSGYVPEYCTETSVLGSMVVRDKMAYLDGILIM